MHGRSTMLTLLLVAMLGVFSPSTRLALAGQPACAAAPTLTDAATAPALLNFTACSMGALTLVVNDSTASGNVVHIALTGATINGDISIKLASATFPVVVGVSIVGCSVTGTLSITGATVANVLVNRTTLKSVSISQSIMSGTAIVEGCTLESLQLVGTSVQSLLSINRNSLATTNLYTGTRLLLSGVSLSAGAELRVTSNTVMVAFSYMLCSSSCTFTAYDTIVLGVTALGSNVTITWNSLVPYVYNGATADEFHRITDRKAIGTALSFPSNAVFSNSAVAIANNSIPYNYQFGTAFSISSLFNQSALTLDPRGAAIANVNLDCRSNLTVFVIVPLVGNSFSMVSCFAVQQDLKIVVSGSVPSVTITSGGGAAVTHDVTVAPGASITSLSLTSINVSRISVEKAWIQDISLQNVGVVPNGMVSFSRNTARSFSATNMKLSEGASVVVDGNAFTVSNTYQGNVVSFSGVTSTTGAALCVRNNVIAAPWNYFELADSIPSSTCTNTPSSYSALRLYSVTLRESALCVFNNTVLPFTKPSSSPLIPLSQVNWQCVQGTYTVRTGYGLFMDSSNVLDSTSVTISNNTVNIGDTGTTAVLVAPRFTGTVTLRLETRGSDWPVTLTPDVSKVTIVQTFVVSIGDGTLSPTLSPVWGNAASSANASLLVLWGTIQGPVSLSGVGPTAILAANGTVILGDLTIKNMALLTNADFLGMAVAGAVTFSNVNMTALRIRHCTMALLAFATSVALPAQSTLLIEGNTFNSSTPLMQDRVAFSGLTVREGAVVLVRSNLVVAPFSGTSACTAPPVNYSTAGVTVTSSTFASGSVLGITGNTIVRRTTSAGCQLTELAVLGAGILIKPSCAMAQGSTIAITANSMAQNLPGRVTVNNGATMQVGATAAFSAGSTDSTVADILPLSATTPSPAVTAVLSKASSSFVSGGTWWLAPADRTDSLCSYRVRIFHMDTVPTATRTLRHVTRTRTAVRRFRNITSTLHRAPPPSSPSPPGTPLSSTPQGPATPPHPTDAVNASWSGAPPATTVVHPRTPVSVSRSRSNSSTFETRRVARVKAQTAAQLVSVAIDRPLDSVIAVIATAEVAAGVSSAVSTTMPNKPGTVSRIVTFGFECTALGSGAIPEAEAWQLLPAIFTFYDSGDDANEIDGMMITTTLLMALVLGAACIIALLPRHLRKLNEGTPKMCFSALHNLSLGYFGPTVLSNGMALMIAADVAHATPVIGAAGFFMALFDAAVMLWACIKVYPEPATPESTFRARLGDVSNDFYDPARVKDVLIVRIISFEDLGTAYAIAILSGLTPGSYYGCLGALLAMVAVAITHLVYLLLVYPYEERVEQVLAVINAFIILGVALLTTASQVADSPNVDEGLAYALMAADGFFFVQTMLLFVVGLREIITGEDEEEKEGGEHEGGSADGKVHGHEGGESAAAGTATVDSPNAAQPLLQAPSLWPSADATPLHDEQAQPVFNPLHGVH